VTMHIGESLVDSGPNAAHINVVLGPRAGPAGALGSSSAGHLVATRRPRFAVPPTTSPPISNATRPVLASPPLTK